MYIYFLSYYYIVFNFEDILEGGLTPKPFFLDTLDISIILLYSYKYRYSIIYVLYNEKNILLFFFNIQNIKNVS